MSNVFLETLRVSGCEHRVGTNSFSFSVEPSLFRRQLTLKLRGDPNYPDNLPAFFQDMQVYTSDILSFRKCLLSAALSDNVPRTNRSSTVDSVIKTLLAIDILQPVIITNLLERLPEFYDELEQDQSSSCTARLILHQLRWLDYIVEPHSLTNTLIELIQITPNVIQHEIITTLPDMLNDAEHKPIVVFLKEWMQQHSDLTVPILDALSNLTLHSECLDDVREIVLERLQSAEIDDLAVMVRFLLQTVTPHTIDSTVHELRRKLDLRALGKMQQQQTNAESSQRNQRSNNSPEALILDAIKLGLQFQKFVCDAWLKAILALEEQRAHKVIDVFVLIILYSMASTKKKAEQIIRKKVQSRSLVPRLISETILHHANGLSGYWGSVLSLSESLLRASHQQNYLAAFSKAVYTNSFRVCDIYNRQEIVGTLVTHIGSGSTTETNVALDVLLELSQTNVSTVAVYNVFIKGILDYLDNLTLLQIRKLFDVFSILALKADDHYTSDSNLWSDIRIVIRKQLSNPRVKYKRIGIIGSLSAVKVLGDSTFCNQSAESSTQSNAIPESISRHPLLQQAVDLLETVVRNCAAYPTCMAMVYDEMTTMLDASPNLDKRLQTWIQDNMTSNFIDDYVMDSEHYPELEMKINEDLSTGMKPKMIMDHNGDSAGIYMKFYSLLHGAKDAQRRKRLIPVCSIFNLLQSCEKSSEGSLEGIDALLGCGLVMFDLDNLENLLPDWQSDEAEDACHLVFLAINWCREMLNCFSIITEDEEIHSKLIHRLSDILRLESTMDYLLSKVAGFTPFHLQSTLSTHADVRDSQAASSQTVSIYANTTSSDSDKAIKPFSKFENMDSLRPYLRPLKVQVLAVLKPPNQDDELTMNYEDSKYILQDINRKLDSRIVPPVVNFFKKAVNTKDSRTDYNGLDYLSLISDRQLMEEMIKFLPKVLLLVEAVNEDIQEDCSQYGRTSNASKNCSTCFSLIIDILYKLMAWTDLNCSDNQDILVNLITAISERMTADISQFTINDRFKEAFRYLAGFQVNIPRFQTVVTLFKTLERIIVLSGNASMLQADACHVVSGILSRNWIDWREAKKDIPFLVEKVIEMHEDPLKLLVHYVDEVLPTFEKGELLESYPLLKPDTVVYYCQAIISQTIKAIDLLEQTDQPVEIVLIQTQHIVNIFGSITHYVKMKEQRALFGVLLKTSRTFIEQFTKHTIPFFTRVFKDHKDDIGDIFRQFQKATRLLQIFCSHVKILKDIQLSTYVPPLKKALEVVIFQVKMLLMENNAPSDVFFMGALKHRDLSGAQISSQVPKEISSASEDELSDNESRSLSSAKTGKPASTSSTFKKPAAKPKRPLKASKSKPKAKESSPAYRTSSQVPSTDDDDDDDVNGHVPAEDVSEEEREATIGQHSQRSIMRHRNSIVLDSSTDEDEDDNNNDNDDHHNGNARDGDDRRSYRKSRRKNAANRNIMDYDEFIKFLDGPDSQISKDVSSNQSANTSSQGKQRSSQRVTIFSSSDDEEDGDNVNHTFDVDSGNDNDEGDLDDNSENSEGASTYSRKKTVDTYGANIKNKAAGFVSASLNMEKPFDLSSKTSSVPQPNGQKRRHFGLAKPRKLPKY